MIINGIDRGIIPESDITEALRAVLAECREIEGEKTLVLAPGKYYIDSDKCEQETYYISNTCEPFCWGEGEVPHRYKVAINIKDTKDLHILAKGASIFMKGHTTNMVIRDSENVTIEGLTLDAISPNVHEMTVIAKGFGYVDYQLDYETKMVEEDGKIYYVGKDYKESVTSNVTAWWNAHISAEDVDSVKRDKHPLFGAHKLELLEGNILRARYMLGAKRKIGERFDIMENPRKNNGIFIEHSRNTNLIDVSQHFNYGLAVIAQMCENLTVEGCNLVPRDDKVRHICAVADFVHLCMCSGDIVVNNCRFEGAGDDTLNVHGIHFKITKAEGNKIVAHFCHPQAYGFNPLDAGDSIDFIDPNTLEILGSNQIVKSAMLGEYDIELDLASAPNIKVGDMIEDTSKCANLTFTNNYMTRIITRGILITTRGKVRVENNNFDCCTMHDILLSNDAKSWYESGRCVDVTIKGNTFNKCEEYTVCVMPENGANCNLVHSNITISDNIINSKKGGFFIKNADNVVISNNKFKHTKYRKAYKNSNIKER